MTRLMGTNPVCVHNQQIVLFIDDTVLCNVCAQERRRELYVRSRLAHYTSITVHAGSGTKQTLPCVLLTSDVQAVCERAAIKTLPDDSFEDTMQ
jgi:hypothetical protein